MEAFGQGPAGAASTATAASRLAVARSVKEETYEIGPSGRIMPESVKGRQQIKLI